MTISRAERSFNIIFQRNPSLYSENAEILARRIEFYKQQKIDALPYLYRLVQRADERTALEYHNRVQDYTKKIEATVRSIVLATGLGVILGLSDSN